MESPTISQMLMIAVSTLAAVIGYLYAQIQRYYKELEERTKLCEEDREQLWKQIAQLKLKCQEDEE